MLSVEFIPMWLVFKYSPQNIHSLLSDSQILGHLHFDQIK